MLAVSAMPAQPVPVPVGEAAFAKWPEGWASTYRRFEGFIAAKKLFWPASGLQLVDATGFLHNVPYMDPSKHVGLEILARGGHVLTTTTRLKEPTNLAHLRPGLYSVCAESTGLFSYQHHFPIVWFESVETEVPGPRTLPHENQLRIVPAPGDGMAVWPNERLVSYLDFHIFAGHQYRDDIETNNQTVSPTVHLGIDEHGVVKRELLTDAMAEALLHWRIYHDGKLVESGPVAGTARREMTHGPGNYLVLVGAEGPAGFLPVSNFLDFPLFPDGDQKPRVYPRDTDADGTPDFIQTMMDSATATTADIPEGQDSDNDGLSDVEEAGPHAIAPAASSNAEDNRMLQLWGQWNYELKNRNRWWK